MKAVVVIRQPKQLKAYLSKVPQETKGKLGYLDCRKLRKDALSLPEDQDYKDKFIAEYINLIGQVVGSCPSKDILATNLVSKNRATSQLLDILCQFLSIIEAAKREDLDTLLVINPDWVIIPSLKQELAKLGLEFSYSANNFKKWQEIVFTYFQRIIGTPYQVIKFCLRSGYAKIMLNAKLKNISSDKAQYIVKTFSYDSSFSSEAKYEDAFFGRFFEFLKDKKDLLVYSAILGNYRQGIKKIKQCKDLTIMPLEIFLSLGDILAAAIKRLSGRLKITKDIFFFGYNVREIVNNELLRTFKGIQFYQYLHYWSTRRLLKQVRAETFLMTYENNPWERMCIMALHENSPKTKIIGYQHNAVPLSETNMFVSEQEDQSLILPDFILASGEIPKQIMEKYGNYENTKIKTACALRFDKFLQGLLSERKQDKNILVASEGIFTVYKMLNYVSKELKNSPYNVRLRMHPVLPLSKLKRVLSCSPENFSNFSVSQGSSLSEDIDWADIVIYWGSSVAIEALSCGKPVIHFAMDAFLSYDPIFECSYFKWVVEPDQPLKEIIETIYALSDKQFNDLKVKAKEYINQYFYSVTNQGLEKFINFQDKPVKEKIWANC